METFFLYLGRVTLAMCAFYIVFLVMFQKQKHFRFNRIYLLASMAVSYLIPLITITITKKIEDAPVQTFFDYNLAETAMLAAPVAQEYFWHHYAAVILATGVFGFILNFFFGSFKALKIIRKSNSNNELGKGTYVASADVHPFSFFNKIVISEKALNHPDINLILAHEKLHVKEWHTLDIVFAEFLFFLQWFNPFAWLLRDAIKNNLEYITDEYIISQYDQEKYQLAMVSLADKKGVAPFLTALNGSQLKDRIIMMKKKTENKFALVKQLIVLPLLAILIMGLSNKEVKTEIIHPTKKVDVIVDGKKILNNDPALRNIDFSKGIDSYEILLALEIEDKVISNGIKIEDDRSPSILYIKTSDYKFGTNAEFDNLFSEDSAEPIKLTPEKTFYAIDGKFFSEDEINYEEHNFESVVILTGEDAVNKYGDVVKNASVVDFTTGQSNFKIKPTQKEKNTIKGKVADENGNALSGVNIKIRDKKKGMVTDISGNYKITVPSKDDILLFNMHGKEQIEVIANKPEINVILKNVERTDEIDENLKAELSNINGSDFPIEVKGKVTNTEGEIIPYASIVIKGKSVGAVTTKNGNYTIKVPDEETILLFVSPGSVNQEIKVGNKREINVTLEKANIELVKGHQMTDSTLKTNNTFRIGGDGNEPLYVVDGKIIENTEDLNPSEIESITILKDESATNLYGEDGKNGVLIISTKSPIMIRQAVGSGTIKGEPLIVVDGIEKGLYSEENDIFKEMDPANIESITILKDESATTIYGEKTKDGAIIITTKNESENSNYDSNIINNVEEMPEFPGGEKALKDFIAKNIKYPEVAKEHGIEGKVIVSFTIDKKGEIKDAKISRGIDPSLDKEALRVVNNLPKWKPGKQRGAAVDVFFTVPVIFSL